MATFSNKTFKSLNYNSFRPHYPPSFYLVLRKYVGKPVVNKSVDLGCGTGVATYPLLNLSKDVIGLDLSPVMVATATSLIKERCAELGVESNRISFKAGAVEDFLKEPREIENNSVDLITAAQCIHWFQDYDSFFRSAGELLKPGAVLAYFYYVDPVITAVNGTANSEAVLEKANELFEKFVYEDPSKLGPHWEQPGRNYLRKHLAETNKHIPKELYKDAVINVYDPLKRAITLEDLDMKKEGITLDDFMDYLSTFSSFHNFQKAGGNTEELIEQWLKEFEALGWDRKSTKIDLTWKTGYTFLTRK